MPPLRPPLTPPPPPYAPRTFALVTAVSISADVAVNLTAAELIANVEQVANSSASEVAPSALATTVSLQALFHVQLVVENASAATVVDIAMAAVFTAICGKTQSSCDVRSLSSGQSRHRRLRRLVSTYEVAQAVPPQGSFTVPSVNATELADLMNTSDPCRLSATSHLEAVQATLEQVFADENAKGTTSLIDTLEGLAVALAVALDVPSDTVTQSRAPYTLTPPGPPPHSSPPPAEPSESLSSNTSNRSSPQRSWPAAPPFIPWSPRAPELVRDHDTEYLTNDAQGSSTITMVIIVVAIVVALVGAAGIGVLVVLRRRRARLPKDDIGVQVLSPMRSALPSLRRARSRKDDIGVQFQSPMRSALPSLAYTPNYSDDEGPSPPPLNLADVNVYDPQEHTATGASPCLSYPVTPLARQVNAQQDQAERHPRSDGHASGSSMGTPGGISLTTPGVEAGPEALARMRVQRMRMTTAATAAARQDLLSEMPLPPTPTPPPPAPPVEASREAMQRARAAATPVLTPAEAPAEGVIDGDAPIGLTRDELDMLNRLRGEHGLVSPLTTTHRTTGAQHAGSTRDENEQPPERRSRLAARRAAATPDAQTSDHDESVSIYPYQPFRTNDSQPTQPEEEPGLRI